MKIKHFNVGDRLVTTEAIDRYPFCVVPAGDELIVVSADGASFDAFNITRKMDGLSMSEWDNCLSWQEEDGVAPVRLCSGVWIVDINDHAVVSDIISSNVTVAESEHAAQEVLVERLKKLITEDADEELSNTDTAGEVEAQAEELGIRWEIYRQNVARERTEGDLVFTHDGRVRPTHYGLRPTLQVPVLQFTRSEFVALKDALDISTPLVTADAARRFIFALASADLQWHFDDDVEENMFPQLTPEQRGQLDNRRTELFDLLLDPHDIAIDAMFMNNAAKETKQ